jgi:hypothetical protein
LRQAKVANGGYAIRTCGTRMAGIAHHLGFGHFFIVWLRHGIAAAWSKLLAVRLLLVPIGVGVGIGIGIDFRRCIVVDDFDLDLDWLISRTKNAQTPVVGSAPTPPLEIGIRSTHCAEFLEPPSKSGAASPVLVLHGEPYKKLTKSATSDNARGRTIARYASRRRCALFSDLDRKPVVVNSDRFV